MAGGNYSPDSGQPLSDINVTPLVDVMLVLLVIFILLAPLFVQALNVDLPKVAAPQSQEPRVAELVLEREGRLLLDGEVITAVALRQVLMLRLAESPQLVVRLHADARVSYGEVATLMGVVREGGVQRLAFATGGAPGTF